MSNITTVGVLHPGQMGSYIAAMLARAGKEVLWCSAGRSAATRARAEEHGLTACAQLEELCERAEVILSVCPPHSAREVAESVVEAGYGRIYVDANAIAPARSREIGASLVERGLTYVDGGIIGNPAWEEDNTWLYLAGECAPEVAALFGESHLIPKVLPGDIGRASAMKMCFAAYTKGSTALIVAILAAAEGLGVRNELLEQWAENGSTFAEQAVRRTRGVTAKAWRFEGEMREIASTLATAGSQRGFHDAAAEVYSKLAGFKDAEVTPELAVVLQAVLSGDKHPA